MGLARWTIVAALSATAAACGGSTPAPAADAARGTTPAAPERKYLLERVDDAAVVQLYADGFRDAAARARRSSSGTCTRRRSPAATSSTTSATRTTSRCATSLEAIVAHPQGVDAATLAEIQRYTKLFWINTGPYNNLTARKFVLDVHARGVRARRRTRPQTAGATFPLDARRDARRAARAPAAAVLRSERRSDRHEQDAAAGQGHPAARARTTSTSA